MRHCTTITEDIVFLFKTYTAENILCVFFFSLSNLDLFLQCFSFLQRHNYCSLEAVTVYPGATTVAGQQMQLQQQQQHLTTKTDCRRLILPTTYVHRRGGWPHLPTTTTTNTSMPPARPGTTPSTRPPSCPGFPAAPALQCPTGSAGSPPAVVVGVLPACDRVRHPPRRSKWYSCGGLQPASHLPQGRKKIEKKLAVLSA